MADAGKMHPCGVAIPSSVSDRFQADLDWKKDGWKYEFPSYGDDDNWGPGLPNMKRNIGSDKENRTCVIDTALFYVEATKGDNPYYAYVHHHHPDWTSEKAKNSKRGVDCSNFMSHVLNMALGVRVSSNVRKGSASLLEKLPKIEKFTAAQPGDIVYFTRYKNLEEISHCGIVIEVDGKLAVAHSTSSGATKNSDGERDRSGPQITTSHKFYPINRFKHGFSLTDIVNATNDDAHVLLPKN